MLEGRSSQPSQGAPYRLLLASYVPAVAALAVAGLAARAMGVDAGVFTRDPAHIAQLPWYTGLISNLGLAVWCTGAVAALFAAWTLPRTGEQRETRRFLFWSGILTLYVLLDDMAMLHDDVLRGLFHTYEQVIFLAYLPVAALYFLRFRRQLLGPGVALVLLAAALMGLSLLLDQWHLLLRIFGRMILPDSELLEDGAKLLSEVSWMGYLVSRAAGAVRGGGPRVESRDSGVAATDRAEAQRRGVPQRG